MFVDKIVKPYVIKHIVKDGPFVKNCLHLVCLRFMMTDKAKCSLFGMSSWQGSCEAVVCGWVAISQRWYTLIADMKTTGFAAPLHSYTWALIPNKTTCPQIRNIDQLNTVGWGVAWDSDKLRKKYWVCFPRLPVRLVCGISLLRSVALHYVPTEHPSSAWQPNFSQKKTNNKNPRGKNAFQRPYSKRAVN